jgi:outer membrane biosynthesis protein TonB
MGCTHWRHASAWRLLVLTLLVVPGHLARSEEPPTAAELVAVHCPAAVDPATIQGPLTAEVVDEVVQRHMAQLRYCYQRELARSPGIEGRLALDFKIVHHGSVADAAVHSSTLASEAVEECVLGRFRRFQFPEEDGRGIVTVRYRLLFEL